ncbi:MAG: hypothetical protein ACD_73C00650G0002 [uncultured bacterium]|nr:MAG: hypothetical protein ACD_73C00650G0002 [uncultured bacterium]
MGFPIDSKTLQRLGVTSFGEMLKTDKKGVMEVRPGTVISGLASSSKFTLVKDHFKNPDNLAADISRLTGNHVKIINAGQQKYYVYLEQRNQEFVQSEAASKLTDKLIIVQPGEDAVIDLDSKNIFDSGEDEKQAKLAACQKEATPTIAKCEKKVASAFKYQKQAMVAKSKADESVDIVKTRIREGNLEAKDVKKLLKAKTDLIWAQIKHFKSVLTLNPLPNDEIER